MLGKLKDKMTYANVASTLALVIAVGGGGAAAAAAMIPNNSVNSAKIVNNSVKSKDIKDGTLGARDLTGGKIGVARGYAWIDDGATALNTPVTLTNGYVFNASGQPVTVTRNSPGNYTVTFEGNNWGPGHVQVTAYSAGSIFCNSNGWGAPSASVECFDAAGNNADARFDIAVFE
ncbi:hypothetical protein DJ010_06130 [Nocardioides silvaticus]|uniref:Uncharacterized protein n=1 Tax=Nocardioides silvaticus TaxID=2201891 RepID=A0A316TGI1_9ACTN|nr:hypothetical protein [Nocardioides silvaticus]PWN03663.1 hypothetical protein DJ010_06130 [Nocardioides silvaticus]